MKIISTNKKALHDYHVVETLECGINLIGCEVKSLRKGEVNLNDSYCKVQDGQLILVGCHIKNYDKQYQDAFSLVMQNMQNALSMGINLKVRINFDPNKQDEALETMNYLLRRFNNANHLKIYFAPIDADDEIVKNISGDFDEYSEHPYISLIKFGRKHHLYRGFPDMEDDESTDHEYDTCGLLKKLKIYPSPINCYATCPNVFSIGPNGDIYKCHRALGRKEYASGNIKTGIEENDAYKFFCNTALTYRECAMCPILPICQGGCKINAQFYSGKEACAPSKAIIKDLILLYREDLSKLT